MTSAEGIYLMCAVTSLLAAWLLLRHSSASHALAVLELTRLSRPGREQRAPLRRFGPADQRRPGAAAYPRGHHGDIATRLRPRSTHRPMMTDLIAAYRP